MRATTGILLIALLGALFSCTKADTEVTLAVSTDVHGMIFPHDFIQRKASDHSLSHLHQYASERRAAADTFFFLLDNGDFLQGQPTVYHANFMDTLGRHLSARVMNYMAYDAATVGNHDIEAGPAVYRKVEREFDFPWLAANAIDLATGEPSFEPYTILKAGKRRIAVLGLITPGIPRWLPENLWPDMEFRDMVETAQTWVPRILEEEKPDLLVGLFHAGTDASYGGATENHLNENATLLVAREVPGFDVIFAGHDHRVSIQWVQNVQGDSVLVLDPGSHARYAGEVRISFKGDQHRISARNVDLKAYAPSASFLEAFREDRLNVESYLNDTVVILEGEIRAEDALFGPSSLTSLIHLVQLSVSGAEISFTAPLTTRGVLEAGPLLVSDMFKLYRYENMLYSMELTGHEIDGFLEHAVAPWFAHMKGPEDPLLNYSTERPGRLAAPYYNFSSAAGIEYRVDVSKAEGERIEILGFSDGRSFHADSLYLVAVNSYRGNGGGGHLTEGAGIAREHLSSRIRHATDVDLRYHLMNHLRAEERHLPQSLDNWKCIPEDWVQAAIRRETQK